MTPKEYVIEGAKWNDLDYAGKIQFLYENGSPHVRGWFQLVRDLERAEMSGLPREELYNRSGEIQQCIAAGHGEDLCLILLARIATTAEEIGGISYKFQIEQRRREMMRQSMDMMRHRVYWPPYPSPEQLRQLNR